MLKAVQGLMLLGLLLFTGVQYNDPDWFIWIPIYGFAAVLSALALANRYTVFAAIAAPAFFIGFLITLPHWRWPWSVWIEIEQAREGGGLLLIGIWLTFLAAMWYKKKGHAASENRAPEE